LPKLCGKHRHQINKDFTYWKRRLVVDSDNREIGQELDRIEARLDELLVRSELITREINEIADKIKFYLVITEGWTDEEDE
jgi:hypothetical protein